MSIGVGSCPLPVPPPALLPPLPPPSLGCPPPVPVPPVHGGAGGPREPMCCAPLDRLCDGNDGGGLSAAVKTLCTNVSDLVTNNSLAISNMSVTNLFS